MSFLTQSHQEPQQPLQNSKGANQWGIKYMGGAKKLQLLPFISETVNAPCPKGMANQCAENFLGPSTCVHTVPETVPI